MRKEKERRRKKKDRNVCEDGRNVNRKKTWRKYLAQLGRNRIFKNKVGIFGGGGVMMKLLNYLIGSRHQTKSIYILTYFFNHDSYRLSSIPYPLSPILQHPPKNNLGTLGNNPKGRGVPSDQLRLTSLPLCSGKQSGRHSVGKFIHHRIQC